MSKASQEKQQAQNTEGQGQDQMQSHGPTVAGQHHRLNVQRQSKKVDAQEKRKVVSRLLFHV
jgi:hypothetical protein